MKKRVSIAGATGYSGGELTALLFKHPHAEIVGAFSSGSGKETPFERLHPSLGKTSGPAAKPLSVEAVLSGKPDAVFLATPNEVSAEIAPVLLEAGVTVIDLAGSFRLRDAAAYPGWYGFSHPAPALLEEAIYGLTEWCGDELRGARLVANPGCYPTSVLLALRPLRALLDLSVPLICDSKSGVSGAGKKSDLAFSFTEMAGNFKAYGVSGHRHEAEMRQELHVPVDAPFSFVPHLLPVARGILSTMHVTFTRAVTGAEVAALFDAAYVSAPFVSALPEGSLPELGDVVQTPRAAIGFVLKGGGRRAVVVSAIDNLLKGAASQAVQNFNRVFSFAETEGLV
jgi:N-acetyl-gamma-glutamyl-phosphate reductase